MLMSGDIMWNSSSAGGSGCESVDGLFGQRQIHLLPLLDQEDLVLGGGEWRVVLHRVQFRIGDIVDLGLEWEVSLQTPVTTVLGGIGSGDGLDDGVW